jgi:hypothetical protein
VEICVTIARNPLFPLRWRLTPVNLRPPFLNMNGDFNAVAASCFDDDKGIIA